MDNLEMELQTIRQKLQTLKATPPETIAAPWGQSRVAPSPSLVQVTTAINTLRQRSGQMPVATPSANLQQFDMTLVAIDNLAQQQEQALKRLQAIGDSLIHHRHTGISSEVVDIARFLDTCQVIEIPTIGRDANGYLNLGYHRVNFRQAEQDATSNAAHLRLRSQLFQHPLAPSQPPPKHFKTAQHYRLESKSEGWVDDFKNIYRLVSQAMNRWTHQHLPSKKHSRLSQFTFLDSAIWCIGAIISRIILHQTFRAYPALWTPIAISLITGIAISIYSSFFSSRPNSILGYRTLTIIVGLLLGGYFL